MTWARVDSFAGNATASALTEYRPCPICESLRFRPIVTLEDFQFFSDSAEVPKRATICQVQCRDCFALLMNPCYSRFGFRVLFDEAEQSYGATVGRPDEQVDWLGERGMLEPGQAVLDIGCYDALLLGRLPNHVRKLGVDIDATAIQRGRDRLRGQDVELVIGDFETFELTQTPDTIVMFHVLEHLAAPGDVLRKLRSVSHPRSRLVIEVPIVEMAESNDLVGFFTAQHLTHFSRQSLHNCLVAAGWTPIEWVQQEDYNGCRVVAEPGAVVNGPVGDPADVVHVARIAARWYQAATDVCRSLEPALSAERCIIWGAGMHTEYLYQRTPLFQARAGREYCLIDSDPRKHGQTWRGIPIQPPETLSRIYADDIPVIVSSYGNQEEIAAAAAELGADRASIVKLYDQVRIY